MNNLYGQNNKENQNRRAVGTCYETAAMRFLETQGYRILCRNYRTRRGEIDLIALCEDGRTLAFIEVKYRKTARCGMPSEAVDVRKQIRIRNTAEQYLLENALFDAAVRFDVVEILDNKIRVIKHAFTAYL
ncbi:MAG: YraN family protein [Eubacteriales bacterium]|nr:YraN family protein [Eubacteriales bacterium]